MSITKRSYPSSARHPRGLTAWRVRWLEGTRHRSREFASREQARIFEAQVLVDGGIAPALARECPTLAALWEPWLENRKVRTLPATTAVYESVWGKHIEPALGHFRLDALERNPRLLSEFLASLGARDRRTGKPRVGASAHRKAHWVLKALLRTAVAWNHIDANPMDRIEDRAPSPKRARQVVVFSATHVEAMRASLLNRSSPWLQAERAALPLASRNLRDVALLSLLAYCGLRPSEALVLTWSDVDLDRGVLHVSACNSDGVKREPKSAASYRSVPMVGAVCDDLRAWREASASTKADSWIFCSADGGLWSTNDWRVWARRTFKDLAAQAQRPGARPYDLRHSFVMRLILVGKTVPEVAVLAGHEPAVTAKVYLGAYRHHEEIGVERDEDIGEHVTRERTRVIPRPRIVA